MPWLAFKLQRNLSGPSQCAQPHPPLQLPVSCLQELCLATTDVEKDAWKAKLEDYRDTLFNKYDMFLYGPDDNSNNTKSLLTTSGAAFYSRVYTDLFFSPQGGVCHRCGLEAILACSLQLFSVTPYSSLGFFAHCLLHS